MEKLLKLVLIVAFVLSMVGCSSQPSEIDELKKQIAQLQIDNQTLQNTNNQLATNNIALQREINQLKIVDYPSTYRLSGGAYVCPQLHGSEIREVRFLSNTLIHVSGRDIQNILIFDNYYIYRQDTNGDFLLVKEAVVNEIRGPWNAQILHDANLLTVIKVSGDQQSLTFSPLYNVTCEFVSDTPFTFID